MHVLIIKTKYNSLTNWRYQNNQMKKQKHIV